MHTVNFAKPEIHDYIKLGNCLACRNMPIPAEQFHGEVGPSLDGIGGCCGAAQLRLRMVNPKVFNPFECV